MTTSREKNKKEKKQRYMQDVEENSQYIDEHKKRIRKANSSGGKRKITTTI